MSPPEVWGPAIWRLFHTLVSHINDNVYHHIYPQLFYQIQRICKFLPCPECAQDASTFLAKVKLSDLKTKRDFINIFYLFHNYVNAKKRKPLYNYANINIYNNYRIINVVNNFIAVYNTKGNMKLISESFQRQFVIKDFKNWIMNNIKFFVPVSVPLPIQSSISETIEEKQENNVEIQETVISEEVQETVTSEEVQETVISEEVQETVISEEVQETVISEEVQETVISEEVQETVISEEVQETVISEEVQETVISEEVQETVTSEEVQETLISEEVQETVTSEEVQETLISEEVQETVISEEMQETVIFEEVQENNEEVHEEGTSPVITKKKIKKNKKKNIT